MFEAPTTFRYLCANPRIGDDPATGSAYLDAVGTTTDENNWLRSWSNNLYLWYSEIEDLRAQAVTLRAEGYRMKDVIRFVVTRDFFLMK